MRRRFAERRVDHRQPDLQQYWLRRIRPINAPIDLVGNAIYSNQYGIYSGQSTPAVRSRSPTTSSSQMRLSAIRLTSGQPSCLRDRQQHDLRANGGWASTPAPRTTSTCATTASGRRRVTASISPTTARTISRATTTCSTPRGTGNIGYWQGDRATLTSLAVR